MSFDFNDKGSVGKLKISANYLLATQKKRHLFIRLDPCFDFANRSDIFSLEKSILFSFLSDISLDMSLVIQEINEFIAVQLFKKSFQLQAYNYITCNPFFVTNQYVYGLNFINI